MDFGASTDHQAGGTDYWFFMTQKMADMYHFPQRFVPLYRLRAQPGQSVRPSQHRAHAARLSGGAVLPAHRSAVHAARQPGWRAAHVQLHELRQRRAARHVPALRIAAQDRRPGDSAHLGVGQHGHGLARQERSEAGAGGRDLPGRALQLRGQERAARGARRRGEEGAGRIPGRRAWCGMRGRRAIGSA